jgi:hypothetical protein
MAARERISGKAEDWKPQQADDLRNGNFADHTSGEFEDVELPKSALISPGP